MCGRARCTMSRETIQNATNCSNWIDQDKYLPCENICPGSILPVMISFDGDNNCLRNMLWGLIPSSNDPSSKPNFFKMFNARSESLCEKKSFKKLLKTRRCIVIIDGFYEWSTECGRKQPYYIFLNDRKPLMVAGLYDIWESNDSTTIHSCTMLTCSSSKSISMLHDRQPAVLNEGAIFKWLHTNILNQMSINDFFQKYANNNFIFHPVHPRMSKPSYQNIDCTKAVQLFPSINRFLQLMSPEVKLESENESNLIARDKALTYDTQHIHTLNIESVPMATSTTTTTNNTSNQDEIIKLESENESNLIARDRVLTDDTQHIHTLYIENVPMATSTTTTTNNTSNQDEIIYANVSNIAVDLPVSPSTGSGSTISSTNDDFESNSDSGHPEYKKDVSCTSSSSSSSRGNRKRQRTLSKGKQVYENPSVLNYFKRNNSLAKELF